MVHFVQPPNDFRVVEGGGIRVAVAAEGVDDAAVQSLGFWQFIVRTIGYGRLHPGPLAPQIDARGGVHHLGDMRPTAEGTLGVGLNAGVEAVTDVVRGLDEAGIRVQHLELNEPSLDDVFAEATGYRLEGAKQ